MENFELMRATYPELAEVTGPDTWRQWRYRWDATPGSHQVAVRATNSGSVMPFDASVCAPCRSSSSPGSRPST